VTALRAAGAEVWTWVGEGPPGVAPLIAVALVVLLQGIASAAYPGANGRIAFVEYTATGSRIATVHPDGSGLVRLSGPGTNDAEPSWSAEGSRIVFQAVLPARPGRDLRGELGEFLALLDLDKTLVFSNQRRVSALTRPLRCRNPCAARLRGWPLRSRGASGRAAGGSFGSSRSCAPAPDARGDEPRPGSCPNRP